MVVGRAGRGAATRPCHGCGVFPLSPPPLVLVLWAIGDGRRATGDGRRATGDRRRAVGDGSGSSSCSCLYKTTSVMFSKRLEKKEIHTGSGVRCPRARRCYCCCCCRCCCPGSIAATGGGCGQRATSDGVVGVVVGGVVT